MLCCICDATDDATEAQAEGWEAEMKLLLVVVPVADDSPEGRCQAAAALKAFAEQAVQSKAERDALVLMEAPEYRFKLVPVPV